MSAKKQKSTTNPGILQDAKIVVGIDIGTAFAGFAYAETANPNEVFSFYDWPGQEEAVGSVCGKTPTSLWYLPGKLNDTFDLQDWGWPAQVNYVKRLQNMILDSYLDARDGPACSGYFVKKCRLHLDAAGSTFADPKSKLPKGLSIQRIISDYLKELSILIMAHLRNRFGPVIQKSDIKWCLTGPAISTYAQKQTMKDCAEMAGLVRGHLCRDADASLHEIVMISELKAVSVYFLRKFKDSCLRKGSKFLVVDAGGGIVHLVVYEKMDDSCVQVREVRCSIGDGCDGTFMNRRFFTAYLSHRIDCYQKFSREHPETIMKIQRDWENQITCNWDGQRSYTLEVPCKLAVAWETYQKENGLDREGCQYDEIVICSEEMKMILQREVFEILSHIEKQLKEGPEIQVIIVTGEFSNSPYLVWSIRNSFSSMVKQIVSPPDPGSAVCQGAVAFGLLGKDI